VLAELKHHSKSVATAHRVRLIFENRISADSQVNQESHHRFKDRVEAGQLLARHIESSRSRHPDVVVALPRGGIIVGAQIAKQLHVPLELLVVRKLGAPSQPELALGAIASGGFIFLNQALIEQFGISNEEIAEIRRGEEIELARRELRYRRNHKPTNLTEKHIILVDDGIATGATIEVAIRAIKAARPASLVIATPVAALPAVERLHRLAEHIHALQTPNELGAIAEFYLEFDQVSDEEVVQTLESVEKGMRSNDR